MRKRRIKDFIDPNWFPMLIEDLSDREFIALAKKQESLNENDQIRFVCNNSTHNLDPLFSPMKRVIDGREYIFGIELTDPFTAAQTANVAIGALSEIYLESKKRDLEERIESNKYSLAKMRGILEGEIEEIKGGRDHDDSIKQDYLKGYKCRKLDKEYFEFAKAKHSFSFPNEYINQGILILISEGAADRDFEIYCEELIQTLSKGEQLPFLKTIHDFASFGAGGRGGSDELSIVKELKAEESKGEKSKPKKGKKAQPDITGKLKDYWPKDRTDFTFEDLTEHLMENKFLINGVWAEGSTAAGALIVLLIENGFIIHKGGVIGKNRVRLFNNTFENITKNDFPLKSETSFNKIVSEQKWREAFSFIPPKII